MSENPEITDHVETPETSDEPLITVNIPKMKAAAKKAGRAAAKFAVPALVICGLAYLKGAGDAMELEDSESDEDESDDSDTSDE